MAESAPITDYSTTHIGHVDTITGNVIAIRADGTPITLEIGYPVFQGDEIITTSGSATGLILLDHTVFSMAENGHITLDHVVYDPQNQEGTIGVSISEGIFTFLSGEIAKTDPEAMAIDTPVATIDIRGTQVGIDFSDGENLTVVMMKEEDGLVGEAVIRNEFGIEILNSAHQATSVAGKNVAPGEVFNVSNGQIHELFGFTLGHLPEIGDANPYDVEEAAFEAFAEEELTEEVLAEETAPPDEEVPDEKETQESDLEDPATFETASGEQENPPPDETIKVLAEDYVNGNPEIDQTTVADFKTETSDTNESTRTPSAPVKARRNEILETEKTEGTNPESEPVPINTDPVAFDDTETADEDNVLLGQLTATDVDQDNLTFALHQEGAPEHGELVLTTDGGYTFTPDNDFSGQDTFTYEVFDGRGGYDKATVILTIAPVADKPTLSVDDTTFGTDTLPGDDKIKGSKDDDVLYGGGGSDTINAKGGDDILYGDGGETGPATIDLNIAAALTDADLSETLSVRIRGVPEGATLSSGSQSDGVWTLDSDDLENLNLTLPDGYTNDIQLDVEATAIDGETPEPAVTAATLNVSYTGAIAGDDTLKGGAGDDILYGGGGDDYLRGQGGDDALYGQAGDDTIKGEGGEDTLYGGSGDDFLRGGAKEDVLHGGSGDDTLKGEGGQDTFIFAPNGGADYVSDYKKGETLRFEGDGFTKEALIVNQEGKDAVITFGEQNVEVTLNKVDLDKLGYTVTQEPDALIVVFDETE